VLCLVGKAIGCLIDEVSEGYPDRSIVYGQEVSESTAAAAVKKKTSGGALATIETGLLIFPNPAQDVINVSVKSNKLQGEMQLVIYDMMGKELQTDVLLTENDELNQKVNIRDFVAGHYLVRVIDTQGNSLEGKFVVVE